MRGPSDARARPRIAARDPCRRGAADRIPIGEPALELLEGRAAIDVGRVLREDRGNELVQHGPLRGRLHRPVGLPQTAANLRHFPARVGVIRHEMFAPVSPGFDSTGRD